MAHLRMLRRKFVRKRIDWTGSLSQKRSKWAWFCPKVGVASKILRALRAQDCITTPLLEILDPPLLTAYHMEDGTESDCSFPTSFYDPACT